MNLRADGVRNVQFALDRVADIGMDYGHRTQAAVAFDAVIEFLITRKEDWLTQIRPGLPISENVDRLLAGLQVDLNTEAVNQ